MSLFRKQGLERLVGHEVVVHTTEDRSLRGIHVATYEDCIAVAHGSYLNEANPVDAEGEIVVPRERIETMQVLGGAEWRR